MIDWIDAMCRTWGHAKRRISGIPLQQPKSIMGRIYDEGPVGAAIRSGVAPDPPEVMLGDALKVSVAIQLAITSGAMTDKQYEAIYVNYVIRGPLKVKLPKLQIGHKCFYDRIDRAHKAIEPWLRGDNVTVDKQTSW